MSIQMRITEVTDIHEREGLNTQAETERAIDLAAMEGKSNSRPEPRPRRQRRPAAMAAAIPPAYPGRSPHLVRRPAPAQAMVLEPTAIMERRPAPRIPRHPIPPAIRIDPPATVAIRPPSGIGDNHRRLPATSVACHVNPRPIRCQRVVEGGISRVVRWRRRVALSGIIGWRRRFRRHLWRGRSR